MYVIGWIDYLGLYEVVTPFSRFFQSTLRSNKTNRDTWNCEEESEESVQMQLYQFVIHSYTAM